MTSQQIKIENLQEQYFQCGYCKHSGKITGSALVQFDDGNTKICPECVAKTKELRKRLPILEMY